MGVPTDILKFFNVGNALKKDQKIEPYSVADFCKNRPNCNIMEVRQICQKFVNEGLLIHSGLKNNSPLMGDCYYNFGLDKKLVEYGAYDFFIGGFLSTRNHFSPAVKPIIVKKFNGEEDIGTCFIIGENLLVTALHCVNNMQSIKISDDSGDFVKAEYIWISTDQRKDIAVIQVKGKPFSQIPHFKIGNAKILDEILTMGYPPVAGFDSIQFAEIATINTSLKSSRGSVLGRDLSYLDSQEYLLINARVKGGNSGGPIIDKFGYIVGMLIHIPSDPFDNDKLDSLGYGVAIPGKELLLFFESIKSQEKTIKSLGFTNLDVGFKTS